MVTMSRSGLWTTHPEPQLLPVAGQLVVGAVAVTGIAVGVTLAGALTLGAKLLEAVRR